MLLKFPEELKQYCIYTRFSQLKHEFKIYVKLVPKSKINTKRK